MARTQAHMTPDPRSIITPDAFSVDPELVGTPLATPTRRAAAILVDLVFVGLFSMLGWAVLGLAVVFGAFRLAFFRKGDAPEQVYKVFKVVLGCFGTGVLLVVVLSVGGLVWVSQLSEDSPLNPGRMEQTLEEMGTEQGLAALAGSAFLSGAETEEEAREVLEAVVPSLAEAGMSRGEAEAFLNEAGPTDSIWWNAALASALEAGYGSASDPAPVSEAASVEQPMSPSEAEVDPLVDPVVRDTLTRLRRALGQEQEANDRLRGDLAQVRAELDEIQNRGLAGLVREVADRAGLLFGWGTVYLSFFTAWWNGQTVGKRLLKIRVVRLDGRRMGGWLSFERAGGYAAGFATGLLGFLQILWDPNRMGIHDKIAETVVIMDGAPKVPGPWAHRDGGHAR